jgi:acyl carrier protein
MSDAVTRRVLEIVSEFALRPVSLDERLIESNLIDSVSAVDIALCIEGEFRCRIAPQEITTHFQTPRKLIAYVVGQR